MGMDYEGVRTLLSLDVYLNKYGKCEPDGPDLRHHMEEFQDWQLDLPFEQGIIAILCCPEDRKCDVVGCEDGNKCCRWCQLPVCRECSSFLNRDPACIPPMALVNDMMVFYAPAELYIHQVTTMELLCASVCLTSMVCFTLEAKIPT